MKRVSALVFAVLVAVAMLGCSTTGNGDGVHWSTSVSGGVYDSRGGDLGYVVMGSFTLYDKYPANTALPVIIQSKVKVTNVVQNQNQQNNNGGAGNSGGHGHHHHGHGNGHGHGHDNDSDD